MSKGKTMPTGGFGGIVQELFQFGMYKPKQGKVTRQVTFFAVLVATVLAAWRLMESGLTTKWLNFSESLTGSGQYFFPGLLLIAGVWIGFRLVNMSQFADFLIAVEAEMNKVSWPSRGELIRASIVVIFTILVLAAVLFGFDLIWQNFFKHVLGTTI